MLAKFHGAQREKIMNRLVNEWLPRGHPVAILQGFPGCGKSQMASEVLRHSKLGLDPIVIQQDWTDPVLDLFIELESALADKGILGLRAEFEKDAPPEHNKALQNLGKALLEVLRKSDVMIVLDEFQRLLPKNVTIPPHPWQMLIEELNNSPHARGRLLLVSNRLIKVERWSENCQIEDVRGLPDQEAEALFTELLEAKGLGEKVPPEQRRGIVHRLSGNPRALKTLVYALHTDELRDLMPDAPDLKDMGDVVLDARLLEEFERELLERALPKLEANLLKFMRWLSVHRRPFKKEALAQFSGGMDTPEELRKQLFDRSLLEQVAGGDTPNELAREISVTRLKAEKGEWVQAHNLAANYHKRRFESRQLTGFSSLPASYSELRYHLCEAGRIGEISKVDERLTKYALSQIGLVTPVPTNKEALEERIALLSAIPDDDRPKVLEYQLARCLVKRGSAGDKEKALKHVRRGTGRHPHAAAWMLRLNLEFELGGIASVLPVINDALRNIAPDEDAARIYQRGAELMDLAHRRGEAIELLKNGIAMPGIKSLESLYQMCAELMAKDNRLGDAIKLLEKGLGVVPTDNKLYLYQSEIELIGKTGDCASVERIVARGLAAIPASSGRYKIAEAGLRVVSACGGSDAVKRLVSFGPPSQLDNQQRALADCMLARMSGDWQKALDVAHKGHEAFPSYGALLFNEIDACVALGQTSVAYALMMPYNADLCQGRDNPVVWLKAFVSLVAGHPEEAKSHAAMFAAGNYNAAVVLNEAEMLRLWAAAQGGANGLLANSYPGVAFYLTQSGSQAPSAVAPPSASVPKQPSVLAVATEWHSAHGGVSTFNRELCRAFVKEGYQVWCYVPEATDAEIAEVKENVGVSLLRAPREAHASQDARLRNRPAFPVGIEPDLIISHDRITGPAAASLVENHFPHSKHVFFIHTAPKQIEWFKEQGDDATATGTSESRRQLQISLARKSHLVVGVGPKLQQAIGNELHALTPPKTAVEFLPGLEMPFRGATPPPANECLILGRTEDADLKGLDIAARAMAKLLAAPHQSINPAPVLVIRGAPIGTGDDLRKDLMEKTHIGANHLHIREYSSDVDVVRRDMLSSALVLMPSRTEGFGLAALEAIALGIPVLVSDQSGLAETLCALVPKEVKRCIVHVSADLETDAAAWEREIDFVLSDKPAAFARANDLRNALAPHLSWEKSVRILIKAVSELRS